MKNSRIIKYGNAFLIALIGLTIVGCNNSGESSAVISNNSSSALNQDLSTQFANGNGEYVYVLDARSGGIHWFTVNTNGTMAYNGFVGQEGGAQHLAVSPDKRFLYITSPGTKNVFSYSINQSTGAPTRQQAIQLNGNADDLDRLFFNYIDGQEYGYLNCRYSNRIRDYIMMPDIGDDAMYYDTSTTYYFDSSSSLLNWAVADDGRHVFMAYPNGIGIYPTYIKGYNPSDIMPRFDQNPADPNAALKIGDAPALKTSGHNFYAATTGGLLYHYPLDSYYSLDKNKYDVSNTGANPHDIAIAENTSSLYTANMGENTISRFNLDGAGVPYFANTQVAGITPGLLATNIDGTLLFASNFNNLGTSSPFGFQVFTIGSDGGLSSSEVDQASKLAGFDGNNVTIYDMAVVDIVNTPQVISPHPAIWNSLPIGSDFTITLPFYTNLGSINTGTVKLYDNSTGNEVPITVDPLQSISQKNFIVKPLNLLKYSTGYSLVINGAADIYNNPVGLSQSFNTEVMPSTVLISPTQLNAVASNTAFSILFPKSVDQNSIKINENVYIVEIPNKGNPKIVQSSATGWNGSQFTFAPNVSLEPGSQYSIVSYNTVTTNVESTPDFYTEFITASN